MATATRQNGSSKPDELLEDIESEKRDRESSQPDFEILTYPTDYTLEILAQRWREKAIVIPSFQRKFVWTQVQASKLIESFLLGLPVPQIFLYDDRAKNKLLVIDGQQRLRSIVHFFEGYFGDEVKGSRPVFRLQGLDEESKFLGKSFDDLDESVATRLKDTVLRSVVIKQLNPRDNTSIYHIFERLNTGGTSLVGQEIRNCIYHGRFNDLLIRLNRLGGWRDIVGKQATDKRLRDVELILRFFALLYSADDYEKPMKKFLSDYMFDHQNPSAKTLHELRERFETTASRVLDSLGPKPFHIHVGLNAAVYDAVFRAFAANPGSLPKDIKKRFASLVKNKTFLGYVTSATTDKDTVAKRIKFADTKLFGN